MTDIQKELEELMVVINEKFMISVGLYLTANLQFITHAMKKNTNNTEGQNLKNGQELPELPHINLDELQDYKSTKGTSTDALLNTQFNPASKKEKMVELLGSLMSNVASGKYNDIKPILIGCKDGEIIIEECTVDANGNLNLPKVKVNTKDDLTKKSKFVRRILAEITTVLHADIDSVTFIALMRKDTEKLESMMKELKGGTTAKLENRVGCIWLIIGEYEVVL